MNNVNYEAAYQYMVAIPFVEEQHRERSPFGKSGVVTPVEKVERANIRRIRRDDGLGRNVDVYV